MPIPYLRIHLHALVYRLEFELFHHLYFGVSPVLDEMSRPMALMGYALRATTYYILWCARS